MAQVTRRTIRSPWSTGIPEYVWRHQANIAAHNVTGQLPTRRATQVLRTGAEPALGQTEKNSHFTPDSDSWADIPGRQLRANNDRLHRSVLHRYSITSSA